jgi:large subunit ribosomal protein L4
MPKKMRQLARRSALSIKAQAGDVVVVDSLAMKEPKSSSFAQMLKALKLDGRKVLALVDTLDDNTYLSCRNLASCSVLPVREASTYDLINANVLLIEKDAVEALNEMLEIGAPPADDSTAKDDKKEVTSKVEPDVVEDEEDAS